MDFTRKIQAVQLRKNGRSYTEIKHLLGASKSTLSTWLKDIPLTEEQKSRLSRLQATAYLGSKIKQVKSLAHHNQIRKNAEEEVGALINDPFFVAGLMLYWAEGSKYPGSVQFSNSDPGMIKLMMRWFRQICNVPENKFRIGLFLHSLHTRKDALEFWHRATSVPLAQFHKPYIKPTVYSNKKNKLYEGTCVIKIHSRDLLSKIIGWKNGAENMFLRTDYV